jgi:serine-type D-Ala-D-Ala carboxypeptidase/endopeptidase (penicillin-binding protein 4)
VVAALVVALVVSLPGVSPASISPAAAGASTQTDDWKDQIRSLVRGLQVSVSIGVDGTWLLRRQNDTQRTPASNEKLLLSMALLAHVDPTTTIPTRVATTARVVDGVVRGRLWILGHGDPEIDRRDTAELATQLVAAGVTKVRGSIEGSTGPFGRDDWARGWKPYFPTSVIPLPTALTFNGNVDGRGRIVKDPERRAAARLTNQLENLGVRVVGEPGMGTPPDGLRGLATIRSAPLSSIVRHMDFHSINFDAEVLGKYVGQLVFGSPGTIAKGAATIRRFAGRRNVSVTTYDNSGLSYANRVTSDGIVRLLWKAGARSWGSALMSALPGGDQGTLTGRLASIRLHAKTGTLDRISALSGWVWLERSNTWAEFSILSTGLAKDDAVYIENRIARIVANDVEAP